MKSNLLVLYLLFSFSLPALAGRDFAIKSVAHTQGAIMANPPMPMLFATPGEGEFVIRPIYFEASNVANRAVDPKSIDYSGQGLSIAYGKQWTPRLGLYFMLSGHQLSGHFIGPGSDPNDLTERIFANDVMASFYQFSLVMSYNLIRGNGYSLPIFFGPVMSSTKIKQSIVQEGSTPDQFDMKLDVTTSGYLVGVQLGWKLGNAFVVNPYYVKTGYLNDSDRCQPYTTTVYVSGDLFDLSDPSCQSRADSSQKLQEYDITTSSYGLNFNFPTLGLSVNIFAETGEVPFFEGVELKMLQLSLVF